MVRVRLAPSPTGTLHIGTARTAVFNWLYAKSQNGDFLLRIEDTDKERSKPEFTQNILEGLQWLGIDWAEDPVIQSERIGQHRDAIRTLLDKGLAYRCYASEAELATMRETQRIAFAPFCRSHVNQVWTELELDFRGSPPAQHRTTSTMMTIRKWQLSSATSRLATLSPDHYR